MSQSGGCGQNIGCFVLTVFILGALMATPLGIFACEKAGFTENGEYEKSQTPEHTN
jgi:hypothetical protein